MTAFRVDKTETPLYTLLVNEENEQRETPETTGEQPVEKRSGNKDLTVGPPMRVIVGFSLPMLLSMVFQQLYNIVDSVVVGQFNGKDALAAVGASYPVTMLFLAFATGCGIGCTVIIAQLFGLKSFARLKTAITTATIFVSALAVVLTVVGAFSCQPILQALATPENIMTDSVDYLMIYIFGLLFLFVYNSANSICTGLGDSKTPLYLLIFSSVLNIGLDVLFVAAFNMGVAGVAWATFIAQGLAAVAANILLVRRVRRIEGKARIFDFAILKKILIVSIPSVCQQSFVSVGNLLLQGVINQFGSDVVAGYSAAFKVSVLAVSSFTTMSNALSSYTGQNLGAGKTDRIKKGFADMVLVNACLAAVFITLYAAAGQYILRIFVSGDESAAVIQTGRVFLWYVCTGYPFVMLKVLMDGVLRGAGDMTAFMITTFLDLIIRVGLSFALAPSMGFAGICLSYPIGWVIGVAASAVLYKKGKWKKKLKV